MKKFLSEMTFLEIFLVSVLSGLVIFQTVYFVLVYKMSTQFDFW